ncbi:uncharacterized protein CTHT_0001310 [Thermochaetoides thermophila DSM 1495]|uniref:Uncharacterized protein n=1 Tax=Chaetomium thermophilum (strain DSM 1495 / CBS 144.50 / IMI 039719) TaxID=759272 RepID=G0RZ12_CHATD|nr:hypothetical protein CTHT_0001310 [Thermochaetoides thermophila DSM 1495]EGS23440.1 hypothetical protein CTHT_0001310 [Thermochaetoides thermophila DSM 1495]
MQSDSQLCQSCPILATVPISDAILQEVYSSDQAMYPVNLPYSRLHSWVAATTPSLSMSFVFQDPHASSASAMSCSDLAESGCTNPSTDSNPDPSSELTGSSASFTSAAVQSSDGKIAVAGVIIVLPLLKHHWLDLLQGKLKESEIDPVTMFPKEQERAEQVEVGLHVYHIERFAVPRREKQDWKSALKGKKFAEFALDEVMGRVEREKRRWRVLGQSALTATQNGQRAFRRLGFVPTGYREFFVEKGSENGKKMFDMICTYVEDDMFEDLKGSDKSVVLRSEMTVKYSAN